MAQYFVYSLSNKSILIVLYIHCVLKPFYILDFIYKQPTHVLNIKLSSTAVTVLLQYELIMHGLKLKGIFHLAYCM